MKTKYLILRFSLYCFCFCIIGYGTYIAIHNATQTAQEARGEVFVSYIDKHTGL